MPTAGVRGLRKRSQLELPTRNFFEPLMITEMEFEGEQQQAPASVLMLLQKQLKGSFKGKLEFRSTRNWARVLPNEMADFCHIISY